MWGGSSVCWDVYRTAWCVSVDLSSHPRGPCAWPLSRSDTAAVEWVHQDPVVLDPSTLSTSHGSTGRSNHWRLRDSRHPDKTAHDPTWNTAAAKVPGFPRCAQASRLPSNRRVRVITLHPWIHHGHQEPQGSTWLATHEHLQSEPTKKYTSEDPSPLTLSGNRRGSGAEAKTNWAQPGSAATTLGQKDQRRQCERGGEGALSHTPSRRRRRGPGQGIGHGDSISHHERGLFPQAVQREPRVRS